jgi:predicted transcriptional regulator
MKLRVKENENLVRDSDNFAILNTNRDVLTAHERKVVQLRKQKQQEEEINNIKRDVSEIKDLLRQLLERK